MRGDRVQVLLPKKFDGPRDKAEWDTEVTGTVVFVSAAHYYESPGDEYQTRGSGWVPDTYTLEK